MRVSRKHVTNIIATTLLLGACTAAPQLSGGEGEPSGSASETTVPAGLDTQGEAAWNRWQNQSIDDYSYRLTVRCFCPPVDGKRVVVEDGYVVSIGGKSLDDLPPLTGFGHLAPTIDNLFRLLNGGAEEVDVSFDKSSGIPKDIFVDNVIHAIDDEVSYAVDQFRPTVTE